MLLLDGTGFANHSVPISVPATTVASENTVLKGTDIDEDPSSNSFSDDDSTGMSSDCDDFVDSSSDDVQLPLSEQATDASDALVTEALDHLDAAVHSIVNEATATAHVTAPPTPESASTLRRIKVLQFALKNGLFAAHPILPDQLLVMVTCASHANLAARNQFELSKLPADRGGSVTAPAKAILYVVNSKEGPIYLEVFWDVICIAVDYARTNFVSTRVTRATLDALHLTSWSKMSHQHLLV
jgi:hypothetical protein